MKTLGELKKKAEAIHPGMTGDDWHTAHARFRDYATPALVVELFAENDRLQSHADEMAMMREAHGFESWAAALVEIANLKAENAGLKTGYEAYEQVVQGLKAESEALREVLTCSHEFILNDARTRRMCDETGRVAPLFPKRAGILAAIDAAMSRGEQS